MSYLYDIFCQNIDRTRQRQIECPYNILDDIINVYIDGRVNVKVTVGPEDKE